MSPVTRGSCENVVAEMDEDRRKTLTTLIELAEGFDAVGCWDPERAVSILRNESSPEELAQLGVGPDLISQLWPAEVETIGKGEGE